MGALGNEIASGKSDISTVWKKIKTRDFSGNTGQAVKNSVYQTGATIVSKIGSLIFTIVLARLLLPELFGLYSLAMSTIILFSTLANLGLSTTLTRYISKALGEKSGQKARDYFHYISRIKLFVVLASTIILLVSARFIALSYNKPIFLALMAGAAYIFFVGLSRIIESLIQATNNFRWIFTRESIVQLVRNILVPLSVIFILRITSSSELLLFSIVGILALTYLLTFSLTYFVAFRKIEFMKLNAQGLEKSEKKGISRFISSISIFSLSGILFGYIDVFMLGYFVSGAFIGYYRAAFSLVAAAAPLMTFSTALLPVFSRLNKKSLDRGFKKSLRSSFLLSGITFVILAVFSSFIIRIIFGTDYTQSDQILRILSVLILILPATSLYESYFISKGDPKKIAWLLIVSTILGIGLNLVSIWLLLPVSPYATVMGVSAATILSKVLYFLGLILLKSKVK